jgi:hypothetical protein
MDYYIFVLIIEKKEYYCIWYSNGKDGFVTESDQIVFFTNKEQLNKYAASKNINYKEGIAKLNIDIAIDWLNSNRETIDCIYFLDFWNVIEDLANSICKDFYGNSDKGMVYEVYNKLFYGSNLLAIKGDGAEFIPGWSEEEIKELSNVLTDGIALVKSIYKE